MNKNLIITSESVSLGHPDKTCDVIADSFLDEAIRQDKNCQMAVECAIKNDKLFIYGEQKTTAKIDYDKIAREVLKDVGYTQDFTIIKEISEQSEDIHNAVVKEKLCANDQGIVYGYACCDTKEFMPLPIMLANSMMKKYDEFRRSSNLFFPDAKCQVSILYENDKPKEIHTILISVSHSEKITLPQIKEIITQNVIIPTINQYKDSVFFYPKHKNFNKSKWQIHHLGVIW